MAVMAKVGTQELAITAGVIAGVTILAIAMDRRSSYEIPEGTTTPTGPPMLNPLIPIPQTCLFDENGITVCDDCDSRGDASFASMALC